jgi:hypothetical protein
MQRNWKVVVPIAQVSAVACVLGWERIAHAERVLTLYVLPARHLLLNLTFPLVLVWWPLVNALSWFAGLLSHRVGGLAVVIVGGAVTFALICSVAVFWYFIVVEIEMRRQGKSLVRFSSLVTEFLKVTFCVVFGLASLVHTYTETLRPFRYGLARHGLWPEELVLSALFLATWGIAFLALSVLDFRDLTSRLQLGRETSGKRPSRRRDSPAKADASNRREELTGTWRHAARLLGCSVAVV